MKHIALALIGVAVATFVLLLAGVILVAPLLSDANMGLLILCTTGGIVVMFVIAALGVVVERGLWHAAAERRLQIQPAPPVVVVVQLPAPTPPSRPQLVAPRFAPGYGPASRQVVDAPATLARGRQVRYLPGGSVRR